MNPLRGDDEKYRKFMYLPDKFFSHSKKKPSSIEPGLCWLYRTRLMFHVKHSMIAVNLRFINTEIIYRHTGIAHLGKEALAEHIKAIMICLHRSMK